MKAPKNAYHTLPLIGPTLASINAPCKGFRCLPWDRYYTDKSSNWGPRAEYLGQSLDTYTPAPSNPSFTDALHPPHAQSTQKREGCLFSGPASSLDAFSSYPKRRSCPACPVGQPVHQRPQHLVPLVLKILSPQTANTPNR